MDAGGVGVPDAGHRASARRVELLRAVGWGGWWFWDGGERLLYAVAGGHRLLLAGGHRTARRLQAWTLLLSVCAFSLCLLGTFWCAPGCWCRCTPSLTPTARGMFILAFMVLQCGGSLLLVRRARAQELRSRVNNTLWSRGRCCSATTSC